MKCFLIALAALIVGVGIGFLLARNFHASEPVAGYFNQGGGLVINAKAGSKFHWTSPVRFAYASPCQETGDTQDCTIKPNLPNKTSYSYKCLTTAFCKDPAIGVDNEVMSRDQVKRGAAASPDSLQQIEVGCDSATNKAATDPGSFSVARGGAFFLNLSGAPTFTATMPNGTCQGTGTPDTLTELNAVCTVKADATLQTNYSYPLQVAGCGNGNGLISITATK